MFIFIQCTNTKILVIKFNKINKLVKIEYKDVRHDWIYFIVCGWNEQNVVCYMDVKFGVSRPP